MHIDWSTLALQTINVLILVWILARFLFRPVQAIIAKRRAQATTLLADAAAAKHQAEESAAASERALHDIEARKDQLIADAQSEAAKEKARLLDLAQKDVARRQADAAATAARQRAALDEELIARARQLAVEIAERLMKRMSPEANLDEFIDGLCAAVENLPAETRSAFASRREDGSIDVVSAAPLTAEAEARLREKLDPLLGGGVKLSFSVDPAIIAGIELRGQTVSLRNSLRQDLDRIAADLNFRE